MIDRTLGLADTASVFSCLGDQGDWGACLLQGLDAALNVWLLYLVIVSVVGLYFVTRARKTYEGMPPEVRAIFHEALKQIAAQPQNAESIAAELCTKVPEQHRRLLARFIYTRSGRLRGMNLLQRWRYATESIRRQGYGADRPDQPVAS